MRTEDSEGEKETQVEIVQINDIEFTARWPEGS